MQLIEVSGTAKAGNSVRVGAWGSDGLVLATILLLGAIQFSYYPHASDFLNDPGYPDLAQSILHHGSYQFDYLPETTLPPGFPLILALIGRFFGLSPAVQFGVIAVSTTLGLLAAYFLLRRVQGRGVAAVGCLLLGAAPSLFSFNTSVIFPEMAYFLVSMLALILMLTIDRAVPGPRLIAWIGLLGILIAAAILIRSVGVALLAGVGIWVVASLMIAPEAGRQRLRRFLFPLLFGVVVQVGWSAWAGRHQVLEWNLPGYPESYVTQLKVKDGQHPELGLAQLSDIPVRVERNIVARAALLSELLTGRHVSIFWSSPLVIGVLTLGAAGLLHSLRGGGDAFDWYFLCYEAIFWLWPWDSKPRFLFPVVPLAVLYLWRGALLLRTWCIRQPKVAGAFLLIVGIALSICSIGFALHILPLNVDTQHARSDRLQPVAAGALWAAAAIIGLLLFQFDSISKRRGTEVYPSSLNVYGPAALRVCGTLLLVFLVATGMVQQVAWGQKNLRIDVTRQETYPEIAAAQWIRTHEPADRVIMARDQDLLFHYTGRRVVWLPPLSDPHVLMDGIRRLGVAVVVVAHHRDTYWQPSEELCFQSLVQAFQSGFQMIHEGHDYRIFEVSGGH